jgi:hypothetical protein
MTHTAHRRTRSSGSTRSLLKRNGTFVLAGWIGQARSETFCRTQLKRNRLPLSWRVLLSVVLLAAFVVVPWVAEAQPQNSQTQQDQSVAAAARRSRAQKKNAARQSRVITNEDLDLEYFKPGQEGLNLGASARVKTEAPGASELAGAEAANQTATSATEESQTKDKDSEEAAAEDAEIAKLKKQIAEAEEQLKWQQREIALDQDTVYSNPNFTDFKTGKAKLDSEQQGITERQQEIETLKTNLAALQERQGRRSQVSPPDSAPPGP